MNFFLISNMYPSVEYPDYGIFVHNFKEKIESNGGVFVGVSLIKGRPVSFFKKVKSYIKYYLSIYRNYRYTNYDIIYIHYLSHNAPIMVLLLLFFSKKSPIVVNVHGTDVVKQNKNLFKVFNFFLLKKIDLIVAPSKYFKDVVLEHFKFFKEEKIIVSPSGGINLKKFYKRVDNNNNNNKKLTIGFVSRIEKGKGWRDFIEALAIIKIKGIKFKGVIAGDGSEKDKMIELIKYKGMSNDVLYIGAIKQDELVEVYNSFNVFVFSTRMLESLGLVGIEAMACGVPIIAPSIAGPKTYVKNNKNGFLYEPKKVTGIVDCLLRFIALSDLDKEALKVEAINTAKKYDSEKTTTSLYTELKKMIFS